MKRRLRRLLSQLVHLLLRQPRIKSTGQRLLSRVPRVRALVLRVIHGGPLFELNPSRVYDFDARGERQQRLLDDLQERWKRDSP
ncbi:MAG: hypothetical protein U5L98_14230 [Halomonas sp.]|uniref:hypothetical protein n=1 Tax=Halomonas sp. TaxID=1486246 RepID=UPI002ACED8C1|nr:hypothetical protein [Halomonas sp.]MDZ7853758.1 hypothetical protein [Halomonas sp.]